jgi:type I restriction enzyme, S subunit
MKTYSGYKKSGIEWLGEIPEEWIVVQLKRIIDERRKITYGIVQPGDFDSNGRFMVRGQDYSKGWVSPEQIFKVSELIENPYARARLRKGDILFTIVGAGVGNLAIVPDWLDGANITQTTARIAVDQKKAVPTFCFYFLQSSYGKYQLEQYVKGAAQPGLNLSHLNIFWLPLPSINEQEEIVSFLDRKTSQIDTLISKKEKLIQLLQEERTAIINQAVTKGLDPNVPMKDSGIEWLGEIPKHWKVSKLKYIIKELTSGTSVNSTDTPVENEREIGILKTSCVYNYKFDFNANKQVLKEEIDKVKCPVRKNSIIISRMNTPELVGASGLVERDFPNLYLPDRLWQTVLFDHSDVNVKWLSAILRSDLYRSVLSARATGTSSSMKNISKEDLLTLDVPLPNRSEQNKIEKWITTQERAIDLGIEKIRHEIHLLSEYRTALISEAVTGKIDVRQEALIES